MTDKEKLEAIRAEIERLKKDWQCYLRYSVESKYRTEAYTELIDFIDSLQEEPVSEELEEACEQLAENARKHKAETSSPFFSQTDYRQGVIDGAKWQAEQFEKNRLKHCDSITNEQAELESDFIDQHLDKYQRMPTFLDAIEYGMRVQKEQMMKDAVDACVTDIRTYKEENEVDFTVMYEKGIIPYEIEQEVKVIVIKED